MSHDAQTLDLTQLEETADGDQEFMAELLSVYLEEGHRLLQDLFQALQSQDLASLTRNAHSLKGASANIGAESVRKLAERVEHLSRSEDLAEITTHLPGLEAEFRRVREQLEEKIAEFAD